MVGKLTSWVSIHFHVKKKEKKRKETETSQLKKDVLFMKITHAIPRTTTDEYLSTKFHQHIGSKYSIEI